MNVNNQNTLENKILMPEFYRQDFSDDREAADFLGITPAQWAQVIGGYGESLLSFIYTMRVKDVKQHLESHPDESLNRLAAAYGFRSRLHLLWHFYRREHCTPRRWAKRNGLLQQEPPARPTLRSRTDRRAEAHLQLIDELAGQSRCPDTIFLHKHLRGWIAYGHSALLLQHHFTPVKLRKAVVGTARLVCAIWQGAVRTRKSPCKLVFYSSSLDRMTIRCPQALTPEQIARSMQDSGIAPTLLTCLPETEGKTGGNERSHGFHGFSCGIDSPNKTDTPTLFPPQAVQNNR